MKKTIFIACLLISFSSVCFADCSNNSSKTDCIEIDTNCDKYKNSQNCSVDDDEYCVYNECYFDKHFRTMKTKLCLNQQQESNIDCLYKKFKDDMEVLHSRYRSQKNRVLGMIECSDDCYREEISELKDLKKEMKSRFECFKNDIKEQLCRNQYSTFNSFNRKEKQKMKKIIKYGAIYKLPCVKCKS